MSPDVLAEARRLAAEDRTGCEIRETLGLSRKKWALLVSRGLRLTEQGNKRSLAHAWAKRKGMKPGTPEFAEYERASLSGEILATSQARYEAKNGRHRAPTVGEPASRRVPLRKFCTQAQIDDGLDSFGTSQCLRCGLVFGGSSMRASIAAFKQHRCAVAA